MRETEQVNENYDATLSFTTNWNTKSSFSKLTCQDDYALENFLFIITPWYGK